MPAARLTALGVFEPAQLFYPDNAVTVIEAIRGVFKAAGRNVGNLNNGELASLSVKSKLVEAGVFNSFDRNITVAELCYLADRACLDGKNMLQYSMVVPGYDFFPSSFQKALVQAIGLGFVEYDAYDSFDENATRADLAIILYRLINTGARVVPPYDLGSGYDPMLNEYLVKNSYSHNPGGIMLGMYSNYNHQDDTFKHFGKRPVDRTDFYKWANIELTQGVYTMPSFNNDASAHRAGNTVICNVDLSANLISTPYLSGNSRIPSFYTQDIKNATTRQAAKTFLNQFVISMLTALSGDVMLSIDYELDYQQGITGASQKAKAEAFADWYVEACGVARDAAASIGASDRLQLICIYNNITELHLLGKAENEWALRVSGASDIIGIDSYQYDVNDLSNPNITLQNIRYLINNFSLGKPVFVVENGTDGVYGDAGSMETQQLYWKRLFREFSFSLEDSDFLNRNLSGFLIWSLFDTSDTTSKGLLSKNGANEKPALAEVQRGIRAIEKQKQFNPSILTSTAAASANTVVSVQSGTAYDKLTFVRKNLNVNTVTLFVELETAGTCMASVNGKKHFSNMSNSKYHFIYIDSGLNTGFNYFDIYFGANQTPFTQTVKTVTLV